MRETLRVTFNRDHFHRLSDRSDTTYQAGGTYDLPATEARALIDAGVASETADGDKKSGRGKADI